MEWKNDSDFARQLDETDPLASYRKKFLFPQHKGRDVLYFCGNSLGLQPKTVRDRMEQELSDWEKFGVEGHFQAENPWLSYHRWFAPRLAKIVGGEAEEVVAMNSLTVNLHLMMVSFYRPTAERYKIILEGKAFPSDLFAIQSQCRFHGFDPESALIEVFPREGEYTLGTEDILQAIEANRDEVALVLFGGVNYYTGQVFDMEAIARAGREGGAMVGYDLAHGVGNIDLHLHDWEVDFAVWCSYKYLNSGPGSVGGAFVHHRHRNDPQAPRFAGWWGHREDTRFKMGREFELAPGADGWQLSNAPVFSMAAHRASLEIYDEVGMEALGKKRRKMNRYFDYLLDDISSRHPSPWEIITPREEKARGCQVSLLVRERGRELFDYLTDRGVVADWREPNAIRMAAVPLYNSYTDLWQLAQWLEEFLAKNPSPSVRGTG